jgi:hypothetical protein
MNKKRKEKKRTEQTQHKMRTVSKPRETQTALVGLFFILRIDNIVTSYLLLHQPIIIVIIHLKLDPSSTSKQQKESEESKHPRIRNKKEKETHMNKLTKTTPFPIDL